MGLENQDLSALLRRHRRSVGLTQEELAERAGISSRTISDVERGLRIAVYRDTAARLAEALGLADEQMGEFLAVARGRARTRRDGLWSAEAESGTAGTRLPAQVTRLIGRERELIVLVGALKDPARRLVTLTGPGGIGKTRLAVDAAVMAQADFADGLFFVSLAAGDVASVLPMIVRALGITRAREPLMDAVVERVGRKGCLLVLDTFEHVLEAAPLIADLLARCPRVKVLATSRELLHLRGEHEFPVPTLGVPPDTRLVPEQLMRYPATVLFVERARAAKPDLVIDAGAAQAIAEISRRLNGLPLAIELAAARVRHLPLLALQKHLHHRLELLTGGPRDLPRRQQTMRQTVGWSYELLASSEQSLFRCLSVFAGESTVEAARSACRSDAGLNEVFEVMSALVDKSLLLVREYPSGQTRYAMLDVVREYAAERLQELGEADNALRRHAEYFQTVAEAAEREFGTASQQTWFDRLDADHEDLRAGLRWAIEKRDADLALRLAGALWQFWRSHGDYAEGRMWLRAALALLTGNTRRARSLFRRALATFRELKDQWGMAEALEAFSALSAANGMAGRSARLAGAAEAFRDAFGARALPVDRVSIDAYLATAKRSVGHRLWREAWEVGRQLELEDAIDLALVDRA
jgi:predicted ATPase/transcriptional regulator with XRE-family HTH domain